MLLVTTSVHFHSFVLNLFSPEVLTLTPLWAKPIIAVHMYIVHLVRNKSFRVAGKPSLQTVYANMTRKNFSNVLSLQKC